MEAARRIHTQPALPAVNPDDLVPFQIAGAGGQGSVATVVHSPTGEMFALKMIPKAGLSNQGLEFVFLEQATSLRLVGCPYVPQLRASWEDSDHFYLLSVRPSAPLPSLW